MGTLVFYSLADTVLLVRVLPSSLGRVRPGVWSTGLPRFTTNLLVLLFFLFVALGLRSGFLATGEVMCLVSCCGGVALML